MPEKDKHETGAPALVELRPPSPERQAEMTKDVRAIKTNDDVKSFRDKYSEEEIRWLIGDWGDEQKNPLSEGERERLIGILRVYHRNEQLKGRMERLILEAKLIHKASASSGDSGNLRFEETRGAFKALSKAGEILMAEEDATLQQTVAQVVREIIRTTLFGKTVWKGRSGEFLLFGDVGEVMQRYPRKEIELVDVLKGTHVEIWQQFLKRQNPSASSEQRLDRPGEE